MKSAAKSKRTRLTAWLLVVAYLFCIPGVAPAFVASLARLSGEHEVQFTLDDDHVDVVLHHEDEHHDHECSGLSKLLAGISGHDHDHDHVLHFAAHGDAIGARNTSFNLVPAVQLFVEWKETAFHPIRHLSEERLRTLAPRKGVPSATLCLRTTVIVV